VVAGAGEQLDVPRRGRVQGRLTLEVAQAAAVRADDSVCVARVKVGQLEVREHVARLGRARGRPRQHCLEQADALVPASHLEEVGGPVSRLARLALRVVVARRGDPGLVGCRDLLRGGAAGTRPLETAELDGVHPVPGYREPSRHVLERRRDLGDRDLGEVGQVPDHPLERPEQRVRVVGVEQVGALVVEAQRTRERDVSLRDVASPHVGVDEGRVRVGADLVGPFRLDTLDLGQRRGGPCDPVRQRVRAAEGGLGFLARPGHGWSSRSSCVVWSGARCSALSRSVVRAPSRRRASASWSGRPDDRRLVT